MLLAAITVFACATGCETAHPTSTGTIIYYNASCKYEAYATQNDQGVFELVQMKMNGQRNTIPEGETITGDLTGYFQRTIHTHSLKVYNWNVPHSYDLQVNIQYHATDRKDALRYIKELGC